LRANSEIFVIAPSDGCPATTNLLSLDASLAIPTRVLRFEVSGLRRRTPVRPVILTGHTGTHRSDRSRATATPSSILRSWLCGSTKEPSGFLVNHSKPRELGVASVNNHSWLGSHVVPARPWFWGSTNKPLNQQYIYRPVLFHTLGMEYYSIPETDYCTATRQPPPALHPQRPRLLIFFLNIGFFGRWLFMGPRAIWIMFLCVACRMFLCVACWMTFFKKCRAECVVRRGGTSFP
jgi:hypothetical protein